MLHIFKSFLEKMRSNFGRIAKATKNEMTVGDLHNDAWVIALDIGDRRGYPIDFADPADQELLMKAVNLQNVRRGDWHMRYSVRIDQDQDEQESPNKWAERLSAHASSDPLVALLLQESARNADDMLAASYSQAAAYVMVFVRFKNDREEVCAYLALSDGTLSRRVAMAAYTVRVQPSLFDRIQTISPEFIPKPGKQWVTKTGDSRTPRQMEWIF